MRKEQKKEPSAEKGKKTAPAESFRWCQKESEDTLMMWGDYPGGGGWLMMIFGNVLWIALLGILAWAIIRWLEYRLTRKPSTSASGFSALEIQRQRSARGEIDTPTFERMRGRLEGSYSVDEKPGDKQPRVIHSC